MSGESTESKVGAEWGLRQSDPLVHDFATKGIGHDYETISARLERLEQAADDRNFLCLGSDAGCTGAAQRESSPVGSMASANEPQEVGPYVIIRLIGIGGFSRVFEAYHRNQPAVRVALKVFLHRWLDALERLEIEKLVLQELNHPNLVRAISSGETADGMSYLVMSLVEGQRIDEYIRSRELSFQGIAGLFSQLADAMAYAHDRGVVHRDLKPANILVSEQGVPVVADFGLAKRLQATWGGSVTATGTLVGTLGFLAPEQVDAGKVEVTRSVDIYGLGATLYYLLTGRSPTENENLLKGLNQLQNQRPVPPRSFNPALPLDLQLICLKCLEKDPRDRYASMEQLSSDLRRFAAGQRVVARPPAWWTQVGQWAAANRTVAGLAGGLFLVVTLGLLVALFLWQRAESRRVQSDKLLKSANTILSKANRLAENSLAQTTGGLEYRYNRLRQSIGFLQGLLEEFPGDFELQRELATTYFRCGKVCMHRGQYAEGNEKFLNAERLFVELARQRPDDRTLQFDVFHSLLGRRQLLVNWGGPESSDELLLRAHDLIQIIIAAEPENASYRDAYVCTVILAYHLLHPNDLKARLKLLETAHAEALRLRNDLPEPCLQWRHAGMTACAIGDQLRLLGREQEALEWVEKALTLHAEYLELASRDPLEKLDWIGLKDSQIRTLLALNELERAKASYKEIRELTSKWSLEYPGYADFARYRDGIRTFALDYPELVSPTHGELNQTAD